MSELYTDGQNSLSTPDNVSGLPNDTGVSGCRNNPRYIACWTYSQSPLSCHTPV